ncbi:hypothetical protein JXM67_11935 [candidate division WOR-3 bacterium]|nr:hypothetical protein [candidate division WOR-3 bacterium]
MKRLVDFLLCAALLLVSIGCMETECTASQHFEVMQEIRANQESVRSPYSPAIEITGFIDKYLRLGVAKRPYVKGLRKPVKRLCVKHGTSYKAFDKAHENMGVLNLSYTEELKAFVKCRWGQFFGPDLSFKYWQYQDQNGRTLYLEDIEHDLDWEYESVAKIDKQGNTSVNGLVLEGEELHKTLNQYHQLEPELVVWHLKTDPGVKARHVFNLMDDIFYAASDYNNDQSGSDSFYIPGRGSCYRIRERITFSQSDNFTECFKLVVSSDFRELGPWMFNEADFVIYVGENGEINLDGVWVESTQELREQIKSSKVKGFDKVFLYVINEEAKWNEFLEILRMERRKSIDRSDILSPGSLDAIEAARKGR